MAGKNAKEKHRKSMNVTRIPARVSTSSKIRFDSEYVFATNWISGFCGLSAIPVTRTVTRWERLVREVWVRGMAVSYVLGKNTKLTAHLSTQEHNVDTCIQCEKPDEFRGGGDFRWLLVCMCVRGFHIRQSHFHFDLLLIRQSLFTCNRHETRNYCPNFKIALVFQCDKCFISFCVIHCSARCLERLEFLVSLWQNLWRRRQRTHSFLHKPTALFRWERLWCSEPWNKGLCHKQMPRLTI